MTNSAPAISRVSPSFHETTTTTTIATNDAFDNEFDCYSTFVILETADA